MPAGPFELDAVAMAAGSQISYAVRLGAVDRNEAVDGLVVAEQRLDAAQIAQPFLADIADEHDVADSLDAGRVEGAYDRQQIGESARIVADARRVKLAVFLLDGEIGACG